MACEEVRPDLVAMLDGELGSASMERVRAHVRVCAECTRELVALERARGALGSLPAAAVSSAGAFDALWALATEAEEPAARARPVSARRDSGRHVQGRSRWRRWTVPIGAVAAAAVGLILYSGPAPSTVPETSAPSAKVTSPKPVAPKVVARARAPREEARVASRPAPRAEERVASSDEAVHEPMRAARRATEPRVAAPAVESGVASLEPAPATVKQASVPRELRERPDFFMDLAIVMRLDRLRQLDQVLPAKQHGEGAAGSGQS